MARLTRAQRPWHACSPDPKFKDDGLEETSPGTGFDQKDFFAGELKLHQPQTMHSRTLICVTTIVHIVSFTAARIDGSAPLELTRTGPRDPNLPDGNVVANYPFCAVMQKSIPFTRSAKANRSCQRQLCGNVTVPGSSDLLSDPLFVCLPTSRATYTACEAVFCSPADFLSTKSPALAP